MKKIKRAAIYIRVSTDEQARHGYSLSAQLANLHEYANQKKYIVAGVYADEGASARKSFKSRKELQRLIKDIQNDLIDIIIFIKLDRWFRNIADYYKVQEILDKNNVEWECTQEDYNTTTTNGRLMLNLKLSIAQNESDMISDRVKFVLQDRIRRGEAILSKCPLGYKKDNRKLILSDESHIVQYIFDTYEKSKSKRFTMRKTNAMYNKSLSYDIISNILKHTIYIGTYHGIDNFCPAIISDIQFYNVQNMLKENIKTSPTGRIYLFSSLVICPECGRKLSSYYTYTTNKLKTKKYEKYCYRCSNHGQNNTCAYGGIVSERVLERYLIENMNILIEKYQANSTLAKAKSSNKMDSVTIEKKMQRLKELYIEGFIEKKEYISDQNKLKEQLRNCMVKEITSHKPIINFAEIKNSIELYSTMSKDEKFTFWHTIIEKITVIGQGFDRKYEVKFW